MTRRDLFALTALAGCGAADPDPEPSPALPPSIVPGGRTLEELQQLYQQDPFDDFLPFLDKPR